MLRRNIILDVLKLFLAFMVVGIHTNFLGDISALWKYLTGSGIFRVAVPIFLLINGFYFYSIYNKGNSLFWFKRVLYLYSFWMLFYSYFWFRPFSSSSLEIVETLIMGYGHLWYLSAMMGAAILLILINKISFKLMVGAILITFLMGVIIQYAGNYHIINQQMKYSSYEFVRFHRNFLFFGFPFFALGFLLNKFDIKEKISFNLLVILSIIGLSLLLCESYFNYTNLSIDSGFDNLISLLIVCPAIFLLFMKLNWQGKNKQLSFYATGVYFIHIIILTIYGKLTDFKETELTLIVIISSIIASYFLIKVNNRVKVIL